MEINYIALAIPVFFLLIGVELLVAWLQGKSVYRLNDAMTDLSCGIGQQATGLWGKAITVGVYVALYEAWHLLPWTASSWAAWLVAFFGVDFCYYWWHRWTHEMNLGWITHVVHHQSEDYNLAVALRQSLSSAYTSFLFYLPLAVLGVPPVVFITIVSLSTLYQFWIHTETIDTLGPLEWVLNTPSHHRVHHATNAQYLDKNYAATLIIWDRLFGTFEREVDQPIYGTVKPMDSFNPLWANVWYLVVLLKTAAKAPRWADKLQIWFRGPAWRPAELGPSPYTSPVVPEDQVKYDPPAARPLQAYLLMQFLPTAAALTGMLFAANTAPISLLASLTLLILMTTWVWGGLLEYQPWALAAELTRLASLTLLVFVFSPDPVLRMLAFAFAVGSAGWLIAARRAPMPA